MSNNKKSSRRNSNSPISEIPKWNRIWNVIAALLGSLVTAIVAFASRVIATFVEWLGNLDADYIAKHQFLLTVVGVAIVSAISGVLVGYLFSCASRKPPKRRNRFYRPPRKKNPAPGSPFNPPKPRTLYQEDDLIF